MARERSRQSYRGRVRADLDLLGHGYGWAAVAEALGSLYFVLDGYPLRSAIVGLGAPLWLIAMEVRRG
jgi:hypothetical protein